MQNLTRGAVKIVRNLDKWIFKILIMRLVLFSEELHYVSVLWFICSSCLPSLHFGCFRCIMFSLYFLTFVCYCLLYNMVSMSFSKFLLFSLIRYSIALFIRNPFSPYFYSLRWHDDLVIAPVHQLPRAGGTLKLEFFYPYEGQLYQNLEWYFWCRSTVKHNFGHIFCFKLLVKIYIVHSSGDRTVVSPHVKACCIKFSYIIYNVLVFSVPKIILRKLENSLS